MTDSTAVIRAAYRQVFGNAHLMDEERCASAESLYVNGDLTVQGLVTAFALSDTYRRLFLEKTVPTDSLNSTSSTCWAVHPQPGRTERARSASGQ